MYLPQNKLKDWRVKHQPKACPLLLRKTSDWVVDHCHKSGMVRGVVSRVGNSLLGKIENFAYRRCQVSQSHLPAVLRAIADYVEQEQLDVLHPVGLTQLSKRFKSLTSEKQKATLVDLGAKRKQIMECSNASERTKLFRELTKHKHG
tara:strand:+ start:693 stop:1133 length:441 start_codon:yes stop_codon:yes gene_type:complete